MFFEPTPGAGGSEFVIVGWVEGHETQHLRWVALRLTQPTKTHGEGKSILQLLSK